MNSEMDLFARPETVSERVHAAVLLIIHQLKHIPKADREDLFELFPALEGTEDGPERDEIVKTIMEILAQSPARAVTMPEFPGEVAKLKAWSKHVGGKIREIRSRAGMTQKELAKKSGIGQGYISRIERAEHSPTHKTLRKIAESLGVEVGNIDPCGDD